MDMRDVTFRILSRLSLNFYEPILSLWTRDFEALCFLFLYLYSPLISSWLVSTTSSIQSISRICILASNCIVYCIQLHPPHYINPSFIASNCINLSFIASNCSVCPAYLACIQLLCCFSLHQLHFVFFSVPFVSQVPVAILAVYDKIKSRYDLYTKTQ